MRKWSIALVALAAFAGLSFAGCMIGDDGKAYLAYYWYTDDTVDSLYDENPSTPDDVYSTEYFATGEGTFYVAYSTASISSNLWFYYKIEKEEGKLFKDGADAYFAIGLTADGPELYKSDDPLFSVSGAAPETLAVARGDAAGGTRGPTLGTKELVSGGYRLTISYGAME